MTRLLFLSCLWVTAAVAQADQSLGAIQGRVQFEGVVPEDPTPDENGLREPLISVDARTRGLLNAVIHLEATGSPLTNDLAPARMDQVHHRFVPRVLAVRAGQAVLFTNSDPANHNVRTSSAIATNEFNVFTGNEGSYRRVFGPDSKRRPIRVGCDIHPWMRGWVYVFEHPFFAVTDARGEFRIDGVPAGEYQLHIAHPDIAYREQRKLTVKAGQDLKVDATVSQARPAP